jgi:hypothetical protein
MEHKRLTGAVCYGGSKGDTSPGALDGIDQFAGLGVCWDDGRRTL